MTFAGRAIVFETTVPERNELLFPIEGRPVGKPTDAPLISITPVISITIESNECPEAHFSIFLLNIDDARRKNSAF